MIICCVFSGEMVNFRRSQLIQCRGKSKDTVVDITHIFPEGSFMMELIDRRKPVIADIRSQISKISDTAGSVKERRKDLKA